MRGRLRRLESLSSAAGQQLPAGGTGHSRERWRSSWERALSSANSRCFFRDKGPSTSECCRELACRFPPFQTALAAANDLHDGQETRLSDRIYPPTPHDEATRQAQESTLRDTRFAQPAIGAVSLGLLHILEDFGVSPTSDGRAQFRRADGASARPGVLTIDLWRNWPRGAARSRRVAPRKQAGGQCSRCSLRPRRVEKLVTEHDLDLIVANKNAPRQCVLSGPSDEIQRARQLLTETGVTTRPVPVSAAFHSPVMASAEQTFRETLDSIPVAASAIPVFSNATAQPYPDQDEEVRTLLAGQLARPVEFVAQVEAMYRMGARTFLEVGPDAKLTGLVRADPGRTRSSCSGGGRLARMQPETSAIWPARLASLASVGYAVDLARWDEGARSQLAKSSKRASPSRSVAPTQNHECPPFMKRPTKKIRPAPRRNMMDHTRNFQQSPRLSIGGENRGTMSSHHQPPDRTEIDWTMNAPERINSTHSNGQSSSHAHRPRIGDENHTHPIAAGTSADVISTQASPLSLALHHAQDNLLALERLAAQTAALHRQFLEGQEKTQQIFLKLLDQQQRLSSGGARCRR